MLMEYCMFFFFNDTSTTEIYTLSLHDALPIYPDFLDGLLHAQESSVEVGVDQLRSERRPAGRHEQFVRLPSRELLPQLLGYERHDGMEQPQDRVEAVREHGLRGGPRRRCESWLQ